MTNNDVGTASAAEIDSVARELIDGVFDAVIDLDAALGDPADPTRLLPEADTGVHQLPIEDGHRSTAESVDLELFAE